MNRKKEKGGGMKNLENAAGADEVCDPSPFAVEEVDGLQEKVVLLAGPTADPPAS
jgi:uracil-DNA glycosylase